MTCSSPLALLLLLVLRRLPSRIKGKLVGITTGKTGENIPATTSGMSYLNEPHATLTLCAAGSQGGIGSN